EQGRGLDDRDRPRDQASLRAAASSPPPIGARAHARGDDGKCGGRRRRHAEPDVRGDAGVRGSVALPFTNGTTRSRRLAEVVGAAPLDADALAARLLILPPTERSETPYLGVTCSLE